MNQPSPEPEKTLLGTTRSTPSAPRPRLRSHSARTRLPVRSSTPSGSGSTTKSFSVPCPLTNSTPATRTRLRVEMRAHRAEEVFPPGVEPGDTGVPAEPGPLPADEPPGRSGGFGLRGGHV